MTDYQLLKDILVRNDLLLKDEEAGIPRRHFLETEEVVFKFEPDGSLAEIFSKSNKEPLF
jgi:hypothetical protein